MKALVYTGTMQSEIRDVAAPVAGAHESIVDLACCGICGSDMHAWHGHDERRVPPLVLGHEAVGHVISGPDKGKRVAINPLMTCGTCPACIAGATHLCPSRELIGMRVPGAFAEQISVKTANLTVLPDHLSFARAALAEPLACAVHTVRLGMKSAAKAPGESRLVVLGGGAIGLLCAQVAHHFGYDDLWIAEINPLRRDMLEKATGARAYDPLNEPPDDKPVDIIIDAVGAAITRKTASALVTPGGVIVHIGLQDNADGLDARRITLQEIIFQGSYCYSEKDFAESLSLIADGVVTGEGWAEMRPLAEGAKSFVDIHEGIAPPKIILDTDL